MVRPSRLQATRLSIANWALHGKLAACRCQAPPQMCRPRTTIRFRRCLAPARAFASIRRFQRAHLPIALPEVATRDIVWFPCPMEHATHQAPDNVTSGTPAHRALPLRMGGGLSTFDFGLSTPLDGTPAHRADSIPGGRGPCSLFLAPGGRWILHRASWILHLVSGRAVDLAS